MRLWNTGNASKINASAYKHIMNELNDKLK